MPEDLSQNITPQPEIKEEITSLGITPPSGKSKKLKIALGILGLVFILASIPAAVYLVKQRQEIRKEAGGGCDRDCGATRSNIECWSWAGSGCAWQGDPYSGSCVCTRGETPTPTPPAPPPPTPTPGCGGTNAPCQEDDDCCSKVCHFAKCAAGCEGFDEPTCWTHANCHWASGSCHNGPLPSPPPGDCQIDCNAGRNGVSVTAKSGYADKCAGAVVSATWFASTCSGDSCFCYGPSKSEQGSLPFSRGMGGGGCGSWQAEITATTNKGGSCGASDHGCEDCPTPTLPPDTARCEFCKVYDQSWNEITDLSTLTIGQTVYFATLGSTTHPQGITKARFRINSGSWQETTDKHGTDEFYIQFTIPAAGSYTVESMVYNPELDWW